MRNCETPPIAGRFRGRFKPTDAQTLLPLEEVKSPETPSSSTGEGFAAALIRRVTFYAERFRQGESRRERRRHRNAETRVGISSAENAGRESIGATDG